MKTRHFYKLFNQANALLFDNKLPKTKITLSTNKTIGLFGQCVVGGYVGQKIDSQKIVIYPHYHSSIEELRNTLIHEMVHLLVAVTSGRRYSKTLNIFQEHDTELFDEFGEMAVDAGLLTEPDLL